MQKYVRSVNQDKAGFRVSIPRKLVMLKRWGDVKHVLVEDSGEDYIIIRRLLDAKALK